MNHARIARAAGVALLAGLCGAAEAQITRTVDFLSKASYDGTIQARIDGSNPTITTTSQNGNSIQIGDEETNGVPDEAFRGFLTFATSGIPENATVTGATLLLMQGGSSGGDNIDLFGDAIAEIKRGHFGARRNIQAEDFLAPPDFTPAVLDFSPVVDACVTTLPAGALEFVNKGLGFADGFTQIRVRFTNFTNNNGDRDDFGFFPGVTNDVVDAATLRVTFTVPSAEVLALPAAVAFSPQAIAAGPSIAQTVAVENTGAGSLAVNAITIVGPNAADFQIFSDSGQASLAVGQKRNVDVVFDPSGAATARNATLRIATGSLSQPVIDIPLSGEVAGIGIAADPSSVEFGSREIDSPDLPVVQNVVISSSNTGTLTISSLGLAGADAGDFQIISDTGETILAPGATRSLQVTFMPSGGAAGTRSAVVRVASDAGNAPQFDIPLSGTALVCRAAGDFDCSGCTDLNDFLYLLDFWQTEVDGEIVSINDFLALLDFWQAGPLCP